MTLSWPWPPRSKTDSSAHGLCSRTRWHRSSESCTQRHAPFWISSCVTVWLWLFKSYTERIQYKVWLLVHKSLLEHTPEYISDLLTLVANIHRRGHVNESATEAVAVPRAMNRLPNRRRHQLDWIISTLISRDKPQDTNGEIWGHEIQMNKHSFVTAVIAAYRVTVSAVGTLISVNRLLKRAYQAALSNRIQISPSQLYDCLICKSSVKSYRNPGWYITAGASKHDSATVASWPQKIRRRRAVPRRAAPRRAGTYTISLAAVAEFCFVTSLPSSLMPAIDYAVQLPSLPSPSSFPCRPGLALPPPTRLLPLCASTRSSVWRK